MASIVGTRQVKNQELPIEIVHADLLSFQQNNQLLSGQRYKITDFRTYHLIPNTTDYNEGLIEALIVTAISNNKLDYKVESEEYSKDIIHYELVDSTIQGGDRGRIYYREDTINRIKFSEDFRNTKYRLWNTQLDGLGHYSEFSDNGNPYNDYSSINFSLDPHDVEVIKPLSRIVMQEGSHHVFFGPGCYDNVFCINGAARIHMESECYNNKFMNGASYINFGTRCIDIISEGNLYDIEMLFHCVGAHFIGHATSIYATDNFGPTITGNVERLICLINFAGNYTGLELSNRIIGPTIYNYIDITYN